MRNSETIWKHPFNLIKTWSASPDLRAYHEKGYLPYILLGRKAVLFEYCFFGTKGRYRFQFWHEYPTLPKGRGNYTPRSLHPRCIKPKGTNYGSVDYMVGEVVKFFNSDAYEWKENHRANLNNSRSCKGNWLHQFKVGDILKARSKVAEEILKACVYFESDDINEYSHEFKRVLVEVLSIPSKGEYISTLPS